MDSFIQMIMEVMMMVFLLTMMTWQTDSGQKKRRQCDSRFTVRKKVKNYNEKEVKKLIYNYIIILNFSIGSFIYFLLY